MRGHLTVERGVPEGSRIDGVHSLSQVEVEILPRPAPMPVKGNGGHRPGHEWDPDAGSEPVSGRNDRILSGEGDGDSGVPPRQADLRQQFIERIERIEGDRRWGVLVGRAGRLAGIHRDVSGDGRL